MVTDSSSVAPSRQAAGLLAAGLAGAGIAVQTRVNGGLAVGLHSAPGAAFFSFGSGSVLMLVLVLAVPSARAGMRRVWRAIVGGEVPWWQLCGGFCGALLVVSQGVASGLLGIAVFSVAMVAGQVGSALLMDRLGIGPTGRRPVSGRRLLGALLAILAVVLSVADRFSHPANILLTGLPLLAGAAVAWQQAVNGRVGVAARGPDPGTPNAAGVLPATMINFAVGTVALLVLLVADVLRHGAPQSAPSQWWLYLGGVIGALFLGAGVVVVRIVGVLLLGLGMVAGQLICSLLLDLLAPAAMHPLTVVTVLGTLLTLAAAGIAAWPARAARGSARMAG
ncbi:DMT family transporter [Pseudonocardia spinosispora]|uniref:DMT family transporter n=1 Tax=Pseudonocardia spinosispora TaxID=103441 RepID=UPI0003FF0A5B|nr:DMT family transporter [Pseudonocardia spinosispora]